MGKIYSARVSAPRSLVVGGLLLTAVLPLLLDFHVLAGAPDVHHGSLTSLVTAQAIAAACGHGRFQHLEAATLLKPCPTCVLSTVQRFAPATSPSDHALSPAGLLTAPPEQIGPAFAVVLREPRGPPAIS